MLSGMSVTLATVVPLPVRPPAEPNCWADVHDVIDRVESVLDDGDPAEVVEMCERAVTYLEDCASELADADTAYEVAERLGALHLRACRAARPAPLGLARWLFATE